MSRSSAAELQPNMLFHGRYRIVRCINTGSMGAVYEVIDGHTDSPRALKVMLPHIIEDADLRSRFAQEAKITGKIQSDHIVRVSDAGIDADTQTPFLVMDLLQGEELGNLSRRRGPLPAEEVVRCLHQVALALEKTHAAGIVHRDLKPQNMFVTSRDDRTPCVKVLDFGVAKVLAQRHAAGMTRGLGTPVYMAPEQMRGGEIGVATDIYALGHIAYTLLAGEPYWTEELQAAPGLLPLLSKFQDGMHESPVKRAMRRKGVAMPPALDVWLYKAAALKPEYRFDGAMTAIVALAAALEVSMPRPAATWESAVVSPSRSAPSRAPAIVTETSELPTARMALGGSKSVRLPLKRTGAIVTGFGLLAFGALAGAGAFAWRVARQPDGAEGNASTPAAQAAHLPSAFAPHGSVAPSVDSAQPAAAVASAQVVVPSARVPQAEPSRGTARSSGGAIPVRSAAPRGPASAAAPSKRKREDML